MSSMAVQVQSKSPAVAEAVTLALALRASSHLRGISLPQTFAGSSELTLAKLTP